MLNKLKIFWGLRRAKSSFSITRVSNLLNSNFDEQTLIKEFVRVSKLVWGELTSNPIYTWTEKMLQSHFRICPELIYCAFHEGKLVATLNYIRTTKDEIERKSTWLEKSGNGYLTTHIPNGEVAFGVDLAVLKEAPKKVSDRILLSAILIGVVGEGLQSAYLGARIPGYHKNKDMKVEDYVFGKRKNGKPLDPELYFYLKDGFEIVEVIPEYMEDPDSLNYGVLVKWDNPLYKLTKVLPFLKPVIRFLGKAIFLRTPKK